MRVFNIFDRKQGDREEARQRAQQAKVLRLDAEARAMTELRVVYQRFQSALFEANTLAADVLPLSEETMRSIANGYRSGKFGYLDLLEAQRAHFFARERRLRALLSARLATIELERLAGKAATIPARQP